jgi:DNA-binding Lrp family transcriptional regulator
MQTVFVYLKCELGSSYRVAAHLVDNLPYVCSVYSISGQFDLLAQFNLDAGIDVGLFITEMVQLVPGVRDTHTVLAHNAFTPNRLPPSLARET